MNQPTTLAQRAAALVLALASTLAVMAGLNGLAGHEATAADMAAAPTLQQVVIVGQRAARS